MGFISLVCANGKAEHLAHAWRGIMDVRFLGTGAPLNPARATTGLVVLADGCAPLLIDTCGGFELAQRLAAVGVQLAELRHVIVTHRHLDHAGGMMALYLANMALDIYALDDTHAGIASVKAGCFPEWELHAGVVRHEVKGGESRDVGGFKVDFFPVQHRVPTVAVRITAAQRTLTFSADSLPCGSLVQAAQGADLFICDTICAERDGEAARIRAGHLMHPTAKQAAETAMAAGAARLACVHIGRFGTPAYIQEEAAATFRGEIRIPDDGDRWEI
jgi:ribonuclease BN (tRNA processing enzyme)